MRRRNFWIGAVAALVTVVSLSAFVERPWHRHANWARNGCHYDGHKVKNDAKSDSSNY